MTFSYDIFCDLFMVYGLFVSSYDLVIWYGWVNWCFVWGAVYFGVYLRGLCCWVFCFRLGFVIRMMCWCYVLLLFVGCFRRLCMCLSSCGFDVCCLC